MGAAYYTLPSFRRDAKKDAVAMVNTFQKATSTLIQAKRSEASSLVRQLADTEEQIRDLRRQLAEKNMQQAGMDEEVQLLRTQLSARD